MDKSLDTNIAVSRLPKQHETIMYSHTFKAVDLIMQELKVEYSYSKNILMHLISSDNMLHSGATIYGSMRCAS